MAKKQNNKNSKKMKWIIFAIQVLVSVITAFFIFKLNVLPTKFVLLISLILLLLSLIVFVMMNTNKRKKGKKFSTRELIAMILSVLLSISMILGSAYVAKTNNFFDSLTGADSQIHAYAVYVKKDSAIKKVDDLKNKMLGLNKLSDVKNVEKVMKSLNSDVSGLKTMKVNDFISLGDALYNEQVDAILLNEAYVSFIEEKHPKFIDETRIVWEYEIKEKLDNIAKEVDVTKNPFIIYLSGIDTRGPVATVSRSDVNMVVTINPTTRKILMTSIPRDYFVTIANIGQKDKLTHAGLGGIENSVKTIENFLNIDINYYGKVNFTTIEQIVDALGGVTVNSPYSFVTLHGNYQIVQGDNYLNGAQALGFVRERYSLPNGDNDRVHNQQLLLKAMIEKAISPAIIYNYMDILSAIQGCFETNMQQGDITSLIKMQLDQGGGWEIIQRQLSGHGTTMTGGAMMPNNALYYMIPDDASVQENSQLIQSIVEGN